MNRHKDNQVDKLVTRDVDHHGRRITNASPSKDKNDYTIRAELDNLYSQIKTQLDLIRNSLNDVVNGASKILTINKITKISDRGVITESALTDSGSKISSTEPIEIDLGATPSKSQFNLRANGLGVYSELAYAANNIQTLYDAEYLGSVFIARSVSSIAIVKINDKLRVRFKGTLTPGSSFSYDATEPFTIDAVTGDVALPFLTTNKGLVHTDSNGKLTSAVFLPSESPGYAIVNLTGQTAAIGGTAILPGGVIPIAGKLYVLHLYFEITTVGTGGTIDLSITWVGSAAHTQTYSLSTTSLNNYTTACIPIVADGANNLQYTVVFTGITGSPQFRLQIRTTKLFD